MSLVQLSDVKAIGRIDYDTHNTQIQLLLDGVESFVEQHCSITLGAVTVTDERQDGGNHQLWPNKLPLTAVTSVKDADDEDAVVSSDDYFLTETRIVAEDGGIWGVGELRFKVSYTAGYTLTTLPVGLKNAIIGLTLLAYDNPEGASKKGSGVGVSYEKLAEDNNLIFTLDHFSLRRYVE